EGGGLQWLTYEFAVPIAMIFLIIYIYPPLYKSGVISIYEYLEKRFNKVTRLLLSGVFQFSRAFATGITVYAVAIVLEAVFGIPLWINILITGVIALIYDYLGGMKAVVVSDVIQMGILFLGVLVCTWYALDLIGGWQMFVESLDKERLDVVSFTNTGIGEGQEFGFLPMVIGGFFLYTSYYGCDQSQAQRILSSKNIKQVQWSLLFNGFFRFPTVLLYCGMGLIIGTLAFATPEFSSQIPHDRPDYLVPVFIVEYLPVGMVGLLVAAMLAAAMSSLDSALNSLSAATVEDFVLRDSNKKFTAAEQLKFSKKYTVFWGVICVILAFAAGNIAPTVIEAINKIGSLFFGPIIATFILAILSRKTGATGMNLGIIAGVTFNFILWIFASDFIFWFWWNFTGFAVTALVAYGYSSFIESHPDFKKIIDVELIEYKPGQSLFLGLYFVAIIVLSMSFAMFS
ncbi:MAG: sodium/solute symporter, partial [Balneolaceae bacterium]